MDGSGVIQTLRLICFLLIFASPLSAADLYYAQASAGSNNGTSCANAYAYNDGTNGLGVAATWTAGNTLHLCGTFSGSNGQTWFTAQGSGAAGNVITVKFEAGASLQAPYHSTNGAIILNNRSYITVDGGTNGLIENTLNGTSGASCPGGSCSQQQASTLIAMAPCSNCEVKNLTLAPTYVHTQCEASSGCDTTTSVYGTVAVFFQGSNVLVHDNVIHDVSAPIHVNSTGSAADNVKFYNNNIYNFNTGIECAGDFVDSNFYIYNNHFHDMANWDTGSANAYHHEAVHCYKASSYKVQNLYIYNNVFDGTTGDCCSTAWVFLDPNTLAWCHDGTCTAYVWNNIFTTTTTANTFGDGFLDITGGTGHVIYNNTFLGNGSNHVCIEFDSGSGVSAPKNITIKNNAIDNCAQFLSDTGQSGATISTFDYNVYGRAYGGSGAGNWQFSTFTSSTFSTWKTNCSCDSHSQYTNAALTMTAAGVPQTGYVGIGAGVNLTSQATGALASLSSDTGAGNTRTPTARPSSGAWDVGAYNFAAPSASLSQAATGVILSNGAKIQ